MFQTKFVEKIKTHILSSVPYFLKPYRLGDNVEKYCRAGQPTDDRMAHALFVLNNYTTHTDIHHMVARTRLSVTLHVH
jgi:hypothetical protein